MGGDEREELVHSAELRDAESVLAQLGRWIEHYNRQAPHAALGMRPPTEYRASLEVTPPSAKRRCRMIRTQGLSHIHLIVRDLERSLRFYTEVFGMKEQFREGGYMVFLATPGREDLVTLNQDPGETHRAGDNGGVSHFGFRVVSDFDAAIADVEAAGGRLIGRGEHAPGVRFAYVADPDGCVIELL